MSEKYLKIDLNKYIPQEETVVVACSGGVDSMSLAHFLFMGGYHIILANVNHKKRKESDIEYEKIKELAGKLNVPFEGYILPHNEDVNFQSFAREKRYEFFYNVCKKYNAKYLALAHHLDDLAETMLMRQTRGSSFVGYAGFDAISSYKDITVVRPFYSLSKEEIIDYANSQNIEYFEDYTNQETVYTRNKFRHLIIPTLKEINPKYLEKMESFSEDIKDAYLLIKELSNEFIKNNVNNRDGYSVEINKLVSLNPLVLKEVIMRTFDMLTNNTEIITDERIKEVIKLLYDDSSNKCIEICKNYVVLKEYDFISFRILKDNPKFEYIINDFGEYLLPNNHSMIISQKNHANKGQYFYKLCYNNISEIFPLKVRSRNDGDRIIINNQTKLVKDILIDKKIPLYYRDKVVVLENKNKEILFVSGVVRKNTIEADNVVYIYYSMEEKSC